LSESILSLPSYVASLAPKDAADARRLVALVPERANAIEMRLDLAARPIAVRELLGLDPRPMLVTYRTRAEGGDFASSLEDYRRLVGEAYDAGATVDVEHASGLLSEPSALPDRRRVVASHHSPFTIPADWEERLSAMHATGAHAVKLVCGAADVQAGLRIAEMQKMHSSDSVAVLPMGPGSAPGRVLSALSGASLVYGPVEAATAAGQVPLQDLFDIYAADRPRPIEALFGIVGGDVSGSLSPALHNALFRARELPFLYLPLPVSEWERSKPTALRFDPAFRGFSVTQPWKRAAAQAGRPSEDVRGSGAANTLLRHPRGWIAENTDVDGIFDPLADHDTGEGRTAVILGTGGTARAAILAARRLGYEVLVAGRRDEAADALADELRVDSLALADLPETEADLYLNATPLGSRPEDPPAFPAKVLEGHPLVFDCVYRRDGTATATIGAARAARCPTVEGIRMFAAQAIRQARLFGVEGVSVEEVEKILAETLR
jgi:shikimate dehydrogenase/3-dehydroquinate dehydratase type I